MQATMKYPIRLFFRSLSVVRIPSLVSPITKIGNSNTRAIASSTFVANEM